MNWNFVIRLVFILGILGYLISNFPSMIVSFAGSSITLIFILIVFIMLIFGIYKFLKAGLKKDN
jgi:predicted ABC-type exoprotein transport system permease subunit